MSSKEVTRYLIAESPVHKQEVLLAFTASTTNSKTGEMVQVYILHPDDTPLNISKAGLDDRVCGSCSLRHSLGGACYVVLFQGPRNVYAAWERSGRKVDDPEDILALCSDKNIRFGAYGDPAHIPFWLAREIMIGANGWTAYTHQWRNPKVSKVWKGYAMASCDTPSQLRLAEQKGWAAFVATPETLDGVTICDNDANGTLCTDCLRCNGQNGSVQIAPHGARKNSHPSIKNKKIAH
jgi:hypothetical protein